MEKELADIRKEIVEARNLVIKNDNLLKNLGADLKSIGKKQEISERRQWASSAVAYLAFAVLAAGGAIGGSQGYISHARSEAEQLRAKAAEAAEDAGKARTELAAFRAASGAAFTAYQKLDAGTEVEREKAASALATLDRTRLSPLEARALDDRSRTLIRELADGHLEAGKAFYKRSDFKGAFASLGKALALSPDHPEADDVSFYLGAAAAELKSWPDVVPALRRFVEKSKVKTNKDYAVLVMSEALERTGDDVAAEAALRAGIGDYPASEYIPVMRRRLSGLRNKGEAARAGAAGAPAAAGAAPAGAAPAGAAPAGAPVAPR